VSILQRERRLTQWDIKPVGYDNITAEQAKLSGMFPLPGAPRTQPMDPTRLQAFMNQPAGSASTSALKPANAKQAKRVLVHNIPPGSTNDYIAEFFNLQMNGVNLVSGPDPCISAQISQDKSYALVEFKTPEDATYALALDGIIIPDDDYANGGMQVDRPGLSIRRPKDYIAPAAPEEAETVEGHVADFVKDGPNKLSVTGIPVDIEEKDVLELLQAFGQPKAFILAKGDDEGSRVSYFALWHDVANKPGHCFLRIPQR
jgi:splicing factor U2AF subunit